jgi:hypothetical protein
MTTPRRTPDPTRRRRLVRLLPVLLALALAACATGPRPFFDGEQPARAETGNEAIDAVLERLDRATLAEMTAEYEIVTRLGDTTSMATVVQAPPSRRSITVGNVRFIYDQGPIATCDLVEGECEASLNDARISDVGITHRFYAEDFARRLRVDANRRIGEPIASTPTIAGMPTQCVDVPVSGGTKTYCALDAGPLARYQGNDLQIELVSYIQAVDESAFDTP